MIKDEERRKAYNRAYQKQHYAQVMADPEKAEKYRAYHREYSREYNAMLRRHSLCLGCRTKDARTKAGYAYCETCAEKNRERDRMRYRRERNETV